jgi:hypothetical protein
MDRGPSKTRRWSKKPQRQRIRWPNRLKFCVRRCQIAAIPRDDQAGQDLVAVRLTPLSRTVTAASPDCGFAHEGEEIEAAVDGILTANEASLLVRAGARWHPDCEFPRRDGRAPAHAIRMA